MERRGDWQRVAVADVADVADECPVRDDWCLVIVPWDTVFVPRLSSVRGQLRFNAAVRCCCTLLLHSKPLAVLQRRCSVLCCPVEAEQDPKPSVTGYCYARSM
jgi:hypothetical protein